MAINYDPAKEPCSPNYEGYEDMLDGPGRQSVIQGPGGKTTLIENNEKGILETNLFGVIALHQYADLSSTHDAERQGIYRTNSVGDND
ncbi:MAG TPA: hypothetical protein VIY48_01285 [Candidatus Paceibacterota bacterium]